MNSDFEKKPNEGEEANDPIRRGYTAPEQNEAKPESEDGATEYRYKAEKLGRGGNYYFDHTKNTAAEEKTGAQTQTPPTASAPGGYYEYRSTTPPENSSRANSLATASLILGIVGLVLLCTCCGALVATLGLGIAGLICATKARTPEGLMPGTAKVGLGLAIANLVAGVLSLFGTAFFILIIIFAEETDSTTAIYLMNTMTAVI